jgi:hypothetical protein
VKKAVLEKFGDGGAKDSLQVMAGEQTILIEDSGRIAEGTRDDLLVALRKAASYDDYWKILANEGRILG